LRRLLNFPAMASARSASYNKRLAALKSHDGDVDEFISDTTNHKPNDEIFGNRLEMLKGKTAMKSKRF
jgi:glycyl-tRNA synthetase beta subunit